MESRFDRIEEKLDKISELQADMGASLREHIRRTEIAELNIESLAKEMKPIQEHIASVRGFGKIVLALSAIGAAIATIWQSFGGK